MAAALARQRMQEYRKNLRRARRQVVHPHPATGPGLTGQPIQRKQAVSDLGNPVEPGVTKSHDH
jgi:hypothetical protein